MRSVRATLVTMLALIVACVGPVPAQGPVVPLPAGATSMSVPGADLVLQRVRRAVATYFGVAPESVTDRTHLERDLRADPMDVLDLIAMLCREEGVAVPERGDLVTVAAIAEYLRTAPAAGPGIARRGPGGPDVLPPQPGRVATRTVLYATDRKPTGSALPAEVFGGERQATRRLAYGECEVTIPLSVHRLGQEEQPVWYRLEWSEDPEKHIVLKSVRPLEPSAFFGRVRAGREGAAPDVFVFIHGYNVSFDRAARRTAQIAHDLGFDGVPIFYSWPSAGRLTAYFADRESAEWSAPHLASLLEELLREVRGGRLNLVAHSMGNQVLIRALYALSLRRGVAPDTLFENVVLAAPDYDAEAFLDDIAPRVAPLARRWTIYASDKDRALEAAASFTARRLGLPLPVARGIDTVDASGIDVAPWSAPEFHAYFASKQRVIVDLAALLRGAPPERRRLVPGLREGVRYWTLAPL
jgi:esterase/lipase superfamily enzyme/acyl carrier protein